MTVTPLNSARQAAWVAGQPSGLVPEHAVGFGQVVIAGGPGHGQAQAAPAASGGRQVDLLAAQRRVLLVGGQVAGQTVCGRDGCPDQAGPAERAFQAVPVHRRAAEDLGQRPERDGELAEKRGACTSSAWPDRYGIKKQGRTR